MTRTPFVIFGDAPGQATGLSRIAGDLAGRIAQTFGDRLDVRSVGYVAYPGLPSHGCGLNIEGVDWPVWGFHDLRVWGKDALRTAYRHWFGNRDGIVLTVWDPGRCYSVLGDDLPVQWWGYLPIDAANRHGKLSGPAAEVLPEYDRLLAYGPYGHEVLRHTLHQVSAIEWLPHGIDLSVFHYTMTEAEHRHARAILGGLIEDRTLIVGCVATNHRRKDLGLWAQMVGRLRAKGYPVHGWLHTNTLVTEAWSVPQLLDDCGLTDHTTVTIDLPDRVLATLYAQCALTIAPGRGEGFGYPIVESQACGCPVLHADHAGGRDFTPVEWRLPVAIYHMEGPYALLRPIVDVEVATGLAATVLRARRDGHADYLPAAIRERVFTGWTRIWPEWQAWVRRGLP